MVAIIVAINVKSWFITTGNFALYGFLLQFVTDQNVYAFDI